MPRICKQNKWKAPVYDQEVFAYRNRRDLECKPAHMRMLWNCGYIDCQTPGNGILPVEARNAICTQTQISFNGAKSLATAVVESIQYKCIANMKAILYWHEQTQLPLHMRNKPGVATFPERYPGIWKQITQVYDGM